MLKSKIKIILIGIVCIVLLIGVSFYASLINKQHKINVLIAAGENYLTGGQYEEAILEFSEALKIEPNNPVLQEGLINAYLEYAEANIQVEEYDFALQILTKGNEAIPSVTFLDKQEEVQGIIEEQRLIAEAEQKRKEEERKEEERIKKEEEELKREEEEKKRIEELFNTCSKNAIEYTRKMVMAWFDSANYTITSTCIAETDTTWTIRVKVPIGEQKENGIEYYTYKINKADGTGMFTEVGDDFGNGYIIQGYDVVGVNVGEAVNFG